MILIYIIRRTWYHADIIIYFHYFCRMVTTTT